MSTEERDVLPLTAVPYHYDLRIYNIDESNFTFGGTVIIYVDLKKETSEIQLNAYQIKIQKCSIQTESSKTESALEVSKIDYNADLKVAKLGFPEKIQGDGKARLTVQFTGILNDQMCGFYRSAYKDADGKDKFMYSTQHEATDACRSFPCYDEPLLKATFDVSITARDDLTVLSNMPVSSSKPTSDGKKKGPPDHGDVPLKTVVFQRTPVMSTYLLTWAIGDFEYIEDAPNVRHAGQAIPVRVYSTRGLIEQGEFALKHAVKILDFFSSAFAIDFPLPKCDLLAVHEFSHGAMEGFGLITYRTSALLFDEKSDASYQSRVAGVVAHELAHQWFGDLVTMEWWNALWLNESFATYAGNLAVAELHPDWEVWSKFTANEMQRGFALDSLRNSHPVEVPVKSALDVDQIFDAVSYLKGASTIRMLSEHLGANTFLSGVSRYLKKHLYGNARTEDLWSALSEESGLDVGKIMQNWITKIGHPVLKVTESDSGITIRQSRFLSTGDVKPEEDKTVWWIPMSIRTGAEHVGYAALNALTERETTLTNLDQGFYKINANQSAFVRVSYPAERLAALGKIAATTNRLSTSDRVGLVADACALAKSGDGTTVGLLSFIDGLRNEESGVVWDAVAASLMDISAAWIEQPKEVRDGLKKFAISLMLPAIHRMGFGFSPDDSLPTIQLKSLLFGSAGLAGQDNIVAEAKRQLAELAGGNANAVHPNVQRGVFSTALANNGTKEEFDTVLKVFLNPTTGAEKENALASLGQIQDPVLIDQLLDLFFAKITIQDVHILANGLSSNPIAQWKLWEWIQQNWPQIREKWGGNMVILDRFVRVSLNKFASERAYGDIDSFFTGKDTRGFERSLAQALDTIRGYAAWVNRDAADVRQWLEQKQYI